MALTVEWVREADQFAALADEWDALLPSDAHPFDLHCWYLSWWNAFGGSSELAVCTVRGDGELAAVFPLRREGGRLKGFVNSHSLMCRPLALGPEAMEMLLASVLSAGRGGLALGGLPGEDPSLAQIEAAVHAASMLALIEPAYASPFVDTRGDYQSWRKENKDRWKAPLEQKWRKMEREFSAEFTVAEPPREFQAELEMGLGLEASGWKGEAGTAIDSAPDSAAFYRSMARVFSERGELNFNWIILDDSAVSFDFCLRYRNRLYTLKSAYDENYRKLAPGLVLRLAEIKHCFEAGIDAVELLGDDIGWKTRFASGNRPHLNLSAYPSGPRGRLAYGYRTRVRPQMKAAYHRLRAKEAG